MRLLRRYSTRIFNFTTRRQSDQRLREEMEEHIAQQIDENLRSGMTISEARRQSVLKFGAQQAVREHYHAEESLPLIENLLQDLRFGIRTLSNSPGFTLVAILVLALGIGSLTTVATWTNAVLYSPWPHVSAPRELRFIDATVQSNEGYSVKYDQFRFLTDSGTSWNNTIAFAVTFVNLAEPGSPAEAVTAGVVSSNYFDFLGVPPQSGRFFTRANDERLYGTNDEIVLSDTLWRERFNANPSIVGRTIPIGGHPFLVAGVAPAGFAGIFGGVAEGAWIPLSALRDLSADSGPDPLLQYGLQVAVRLHPQVRDSVAAAELHTLARTYAAQHADKNLSKWDLNLRDAAHFSRGLFNTIGDRLPILLGASILLMLLVCINIGSLLGQHAARRRREVAIRTALGATPGRIATQVLTETGLLAFFGSLAGWLVSIGMARSLYVLLPDFGVPLAFNLRPDAHILMFVTAVGVAVTLLCGLYPVRQALRVSQNEAIHEGGAAVTGGSHKGLGRQALLGLQLGICFIVLVACGLLTRSAMKISTLGTGFDRSNCLTAHIALSRAGYTSERGLAFQAQLLERIQQLPGVASATITTHVPMGDDGSGNTWDFSIPTYTPAKGEDMSVVTDLEGPDFFRVMGIAMRQGREFNAHDNASSVDVAVINESMAQRYWSKGDAIGSGLMVGKRLRRIVGIVHDYAYADPADTSPTPVMYLPLAQNYGSDVIIAVRPRTSLSAASSQLRQAVAGLDSSLPLEEVRTLEEVTGVRYQMARIPAELLGVYAFSSVLVAMIGLYAVTAYSVLERHREFALRIALGSTRAAIMRLVLRDGLRTSLLGLIVGGLGSVFAVRLLQSLLFGVTASDPITYYAAGAFLLLTVFLSGFIPARRAASVEPMRILRSE